MGQICQFKYSNHCFQSISLSRHSNNNIVPNSHPISGYNGAITSNNILYLNKRHLSESRPNVSSNVAQHNNGKYKQQTEHRNHTLWNLSQKRQKSTDSKSKIDTGIIPYVITYIDNAYCASKCARVNLFDCVL